MNELLSPIRIGGITVKNRMVMGPMNTNFSNESGAVSPQMIAFFAERAKNGVGLFVIEAASVVTAPINHGVQPLMTHERFVPGWFNLVDRLHGYGAMVSVELVHYGSEGTFGPRISSSDVSHYGGPVKPMDEAEIGQVQESFVAAALRAKQAGFDAITLHAAHGYLLAEFLSPIYNKRTDRYGGTLENRARFLTEIVGKCRKALGPAFPIMVRYSVDEFVEGGREVGESVGIAKMLEAAGVDALDLSSCVPCSYMFSIRPNNMGSAEGFLAPLARQVKQAVHIPVICAGSMREPAMMEEVIRRGDADMITLARALLADEAFCRKVYEHRCDSIRKCLSCQECLATLNSGKSLRCAVNPKTGREYVFEHKPKLGWERKRVIVVGAGPAGMAAALALRESGHEVLVLEREDQPGGTLRAGALPPGKRRIWDLVEWYVNAMEKAGVRVQYGTECTPERIRSFRPDVLVLAGGAEYSRRIPGSGSACVMTANEALLHPENVGQNVVVIGGGASGAETAEYFSDEPKKLEFMRIKSLCSSEIVYTATPREGARPRNVSIVEMRDAICADMYEDNAAIMRIRLKEYGVKAYVNVRVERITDDGVELFDVAKGAPFRLEADTVILAAGLAPKPMALEGAENALVYRVGDCMRPGKIIDALYLGDTLGRTI